MVTAYPLLSFIKPSCDANLYLDCFFFSNFQLPSTTTLLLVAREQLQSITCAPHSPRPHLDLLISLTCLLIERWLLFNVSWNTDEPGLTQSSLHAACRVAHEQNIASTTPDRSYVHTFTPAFKTQCNRVLVITDVLSPWTQKPKLLCLKGWSCGPVKPALFPMLAREINLIRLNRRQ